MDTHFHRVCTVANSGTDPEQDMCIVRTHGLMLSLVTIQYFRISVAILLFSILKGY